MTKLRFPLYLSLILAALLIQSVYASYPMVRNFSKDIYGGDTQNWDVTQDAQGRMLIANKKGLLIFDGHSWELHPIDNYSAVRSIAVDNASGRIYAGGGSSFGYFSPAPGHRKLTYHALTPRTGNDRIGDIWDIHRIGKDWIFQGDYALYRYDGSKMRIIRAPEKIAQTGIAGGRFLLATQSGELLTLSDDRLLPVAGAERLLGTNIQAILPHPVVNGNALIVTAFDGCFSLSPSGRISTFDTGIDPFLKDAQVFCASQKNHKVIFGTVNSGTVVKDFATGETNFLDRRSGMQNNTVLSAGFDRQDNIWLGLDNGIDYVLHNSAVRHLLPETFSIGTGYTSLPWGENLLLGSNQGLFSIQYPNISPQPPVRLLQGQIWSMSRSGEDLLVCSDIGVYYGRPDNLKRIEGIGGAWCITPLPNNPARAIVASYNKYHLAERDPSGAWHNLGTISGFPHSQGRFIFDSAGDIWIADWQKGLYRFRFNEEKRRFTNVTHFTEQNGLPTSSNISVSIIMGHVMVSSLKGIHVMVPGDVKFQPATKASEIFTDAEPAHFFESPDGIVMMVNDKQFVTAYRDASQRLVVDSTTFAMVPRHIVPGFVHLSFLPGGMIMTNENGFYELKPTAAKRASWRPQLFISRMYLGQDSLLYQPLGANKTGDCRVPYRAPSVTFEAALPEYRDDNAVTYSFRLEGYDKDWSPYSRSAIKEYTRLSYGDYTLHIRAHDSVDNTEYETVFRFTVETPWYFSMVAKCIYTALILLMTLICAILINRWGHRSARKAEERKEREIEQLRTEARREKEQSRSEIESLHSQKREKESEIEQLHEQEKSRINETLSVATKTALHKNETLINIARHIENIRAELDPENIGNSPLARNMDALLSTVRQALNQGEDITEITKGFDRLYGDYVKRLTDSYPELSKAEIKLACYIKMGLSSKEIAPLLNVAPKSVEMSRYRLRKKLNLDRSQNLTEFLQNFNG